MYLEDEVQSLRQQLEQERVKVDRLYAALAHFVGTEDEGALRSMRSVLFLVQGLPIKDKEAMLNVIDTLITCRPT